MISMTDRICRHCGNHFQARTALLKNGNRCCFCSSACYHASTLKPVHDRFLANVRPAASGCHEWLGTRDSYGYGVLTVNGYQNTIRSGTGDDSRRVALLVPLPID